MKESGEGGAGVHSFVLCGYTLFEYNVSTILSPIVASFLEMSFLPKIVAVWLKSSPKSKFKHPVQ